MKQQSAGVVLGRLLKKESESASFSVSSSVGTELGRMRGRDVITLEFHPYLAIVLSSLNGFRW